MASATLEEKINKIRQKNEEIRRRHEEVEADKQNAAKLNALVKMVPPTDWPERKEPPEFSDPPPSRSNGHSKAKASSREYRGQRQQYHAGGGDGKKTRVFAEGDGPPPDPTYNFLADSEREERNREDSRDNERFRGRGGPQRGSSRRRGTGREGYSKEYRGSPGQKDSSKPDYEAWRAERNRIDEARISRQRTAEGNWRREWDNNKVNVEENEAGATKSSRLDAGDVVRKDHKEFDKWQLDATDHDSPRGRNGKQYASRGASRGSHNNRVYQHSNSFDQFHAPVSPPAMKPPLSPNGIDDRMVVATDKSIKVIVNHGNTTPKGPVMSVKVSSSSIAGTGRVGPRQKPRVLYSSQSESEAPGHKSPDDKTNRVSFNRDIEEQQRYVPKSPRPQRNGENNPKSPYLTRKEFKYDSQQQTHGEMDAKSPFLQRKEIKDYPKSLHSQKNEDFNNRELHVKQKNNNSTIDTFKSSNSQRRSSEKVKHDTQKFSGPKKLEDGSTPKPQRTNNKRTDKSKDFKHSNSKNTQESNSHEDNSQQKNLNMSTSEESTKNIVNRSESHEGLKNIQDNCLNKIPVDSEEIEMVKEIQTNSDNVSELNINSEILSVPNENEKVYQHVSEDTRLIDNSERMIQCKENVADSSKSNTVSAKGTEKEIIVENVQINVSEDRKLIGNSEQIIQCEQKVVESAESVAVSDNGTEKEIIVENVEINTVVAESATTISNDSKVDECGENNKDIEGGEELLETNSLVEEKVEIETIIENNMRDNTDEIKDVEEISDPNPKHEENLIPKEDSVNLELGNSGEKQVTMKSDESTNETRDEISVETKKIGNEIEKARDIVGSTTSRVAKVDWSYEVETPQSCEEQESNNIDKQVVKDSNDEENLIN